MLTKRQRVKKLLKRSYLTISGERRKALPVFIFGEQRSGTNMLADTLELSLETECYHETDNEAFDNFELRPEKHIWPLINRSKARCVIFKSISDSQNAKQILQKYKGRGIWIFRRYQDVVNSSLKAFNEHYKYLYYVLFEPDKARWRAQNVSEENINLIRRHYDRKISDASSRALIWYLRNSLYFQQKLEQTSEVLLINYEILVKFPEKQFEKIFKFLGLNFKRSYVKNIFSSSIKKIKQPEIDPEINKLCQELYKSMRKISDTSQIGEKKEINMVAQ